MNADKFWYSWLRIAAIITILLGILIALFNQTPMFSFLTELIHKTFLSDPVVAKALAPIQNWIMSILGATMAGWGLLMLFLIVYPLQKKEKWAWNALMLSLILWCILDSAMSAYYGAYFNVVINAIFFLQFAAPLMVLRNSFLLEKSKK